MRIGCTNLVTTNDITHMLPFIVTTLLLGKLTVAFHFLEHLLRMFLGLLRDIGVCYRSLCECQSAAANANTSVGAYCGLQRPECRMSARDTRMAKVGPTFPGFAIFKRLYEGVVKEVRRTTSGTPGLIYVFLGYVIDSHNTGVCRR